MAIWLDSSVALKTMEPVGIPAGTPPTWAVKATAELLGDGLADDETRVVVFAFSTTCRYETLICASSDGGMTDKTANTKPT